MLKEMPTVYIGSDHAGFDLKALVKKHLDDRGTLKVVDLGCFSTESVDYPDIAREVCEKVVDMKGALGILICGTGIGMMMSANKRPGIRAAACTHELMAKMARLHNDANVLCLGARITGADLATTIADVFIDTKFESEERHVRRIGKMEVGPPALPENPDDCC
jgi:ribose 5-phosphate isomerase B